MRPVVISGIGVVSPTGIGLQTYWQALLEGPSAIGNITRFDATSYPCRIAGEVRDTSYRDLLDPRTLRTSTHVTQLALAAAALALQDANLPAQAQDPDLFGISIGTALGGWREAEQQHGILLARGLRRVNPFIANATPNHAPAAEVAKVVAARGVHTTFSSGCASSLQAIGHGMSLVASGDLDLCLAGGAESPLIPMVVAGMGRTQELSTCNDDPAHASRPFDREHCGLVLSEGSCLLVLEPAERARARGARMYAEVRGVTTSCDAGGLYAFDPSGGTGARALQRLLEQSHLGVADIDYVCAHANSSPAFDRKETLVIKKAFASPPPVSSIKGVLGHPFGAAGAFQVAAAALALQHQVIPPTYNLVAPDPECDLDCVPGHPRHAALRTALVTSYGYGGVNAYLVLSAPP